MKNGITGEIETAIAKNRREIETENIGQSAAAPTKSAEAKKMDRQKPAKLERLIRIRARLEGKIKAEFGKIQNSDLYRSNSMQCAMKKLKNCKKNKIMAKRLPLTMKGKIKFEKSKFFVKKLNSG